MILSEFLLLFKSDAKQVSADVAELTKKIEALKAKGKDRSTQESKDLKDYEKSLKSVNEQLKQNQTHYDDIANSAAKAGQAILLGFGGLARSVLGSAATNSALQVQAELIGTNAKQLREFGAAAEIAGGSASDLVSWYNNIFTANAAKGLPTLPLPELLDKIRQKLKLIGNDPAKRSFELQRFGVPQGAQPLLNLSDEQYRAARKQGKEVAANLEDGAKAAREFDQAFTKIKQDFAAVATAITTHLTPSLVELEKAIAPFLKNLAQNPALATGVGAAAAVGGAAATAGVAKSFVRLAVGGAGAGAAAGGAAILPAAAIIGGGALLAKLAYDWSKTHGYNEIKESARTASEPLPPELMMQQARREYGKSLEYAKQHITNATTSQIGAISADNVSNRTNNVKIDKIEVNTSATDAAGIATSISDHLQRQINSTISNVDDGVAY
jgi:FtsZ-binding cell division protein ZapB